MIKDTLNFIELYYSKPLIFIYTLAKLGNFVIFIYEKRKKINN